ncbi:unnamed protein product [Protopolystoma xenopodis]|uniref:Serine-threonine/tyrosine-protein kinase catalytic domain-containing protein n=1 Tax=Protopolystoma xenopodis TaxID=117903 RepID=A0A3S5A870_9PLAT|nr:unnamed protein product [Protopolystoma xenopodis]
MPALLLAGERYPQPAAADLSVYSLMLDCWHTEPQLRPTFAQLTRLLTHRISTQKGLHPAVVACAPDTSLPTTDKDFIGPDSPGDINNTEGSDSAVGDSADGIGGGGEGGVLAHTRTWTNGQLSHHSSTRMDCHSNDLSPCPDATCQASMSEVHHTAYSCGFDGTYLLHSG